MTGTGDTTYLLMEQATVPHDFILEQPPLLFERISVPKDHHSSSAPFVPAIDNAAGIDPWMRCKNPGPPQPSVIAGKIEKFGVLPLVPFSSQIGTDLQIPPRW